VTDKIIEIVIMIFLESQHLKTSRKFTPHPTVDFRSRPSPISPRKVGKRSANVMSIPCLVPFLSAQLPVSDIRTLVHRSKQGIIFRNYSSLWWMHGSNGSMYTCTISLNTRGLGTSQNFENFWNRPDHQFCWRSTSRWSIMKNGAFLILEQLGKSLEWELCSQITQVSTKSLYWILIGFRVILTWFWWNSAGWLTL